MYVLDTANSQHQTVAGVAANAATGLVSGRKYQVVSSTLCYIKQGSAPTATAGAGSALVPANQEVYIDGIFGAVLSVLQHTAGGSITVTPVIETGQ